MARGESPFQGRYTVPTVDFGAIERGGAAWGEAYKGVGKSIGEGIEKYGLRKEQQKEELGEIKSGLDFLKQAKSKESRPEMKVYYDTAESFLEDQNVTSKERAAYTTNMFKHLTLGSQLDARRATTEQTKNINLLMDRTRDYDIKIKDLTAKIKENDLFMSNLDRADSPEALKALIDERRNRAKLQAADVALIPVKKEKEELNLEIAKLDAKWREETDPTRKAAFEEELDNSKSIRRHRDLLSDNLDAKVQGKAVKLRGVHMPDGSVLPNTGIAPDGKIIDMSTGKPFIMGTFSEGDTWPDVANKSRPFWEAKVKNMGEKMHMITVENQGSGVFYDDDVTLSVAAYDMVVTQGKGGEKDGTWDYEWSDEEGNKYNVEDLKDLETLDEGTPKERDMAKKLRAYRKAVEGRDAMPPAGRAAQRGGGGDISEDELNKSLDDIDL